MRQGSRHNNGAKSVAMRMMDELSDDDCDYTSNNEYVSNVKVAPPKSTMCSEIVADDKLGARAPSKLSKEELDIENFGNSYSLESRPQPSEQLHTQRNSIKLPLQISTTAQSSLSSEQIEISRNWLLRACHPSDPAIQCYIERDRSGFNMMSPIYRVYLEQEGLPGRFLMAAKKKITNRTSYYLVSMEKTPDDRGSEAVLGKIRGNQVGSQYSLSDHGLAPDKAAAPSMLRRDLGLLRFAFDSGGPSKIDAWIPSVGSSGSAIVWQPTDEASTIESCVDRAGFK